MKKNYIILLLILLFNVDSVFGQLSTFLNSGGNCYNNGYISAFVSGGTPPYNYSITPGGYSGVTNDIISVFSVPSGAYTLTVTDAGANIAMATTTLTLPDPILATNYKSGYSGFTNIPNYSHFVIECPDTAIMNIRNVVGVMNDFAAYTWLESNQDPQYVRRHHEFTCGANSADITLLYSQADFDSFNAVNILQLPTSPTDVAGIANLLIEKRGGASSDGTGLPGTYSGTIENIDPDDTNIVWNPDYSWWEVTIHVTSFSGFFAKTQNAPLPLTLLSFNASRVNGMNHLSWETTNESNINNYEVERSSSGRSFSTIASIHALNGQEQKYDYDDKITTAMMYYRLKIIEQDGKVSYSKTIALNNNTGSEIILLPNPAKNELNIVTNDNSLLSTIALVTDNRGIIVLKVRLQSAMQPVNISTLSQGMYFVRFANGDVKKLIKK